VCPQPYDNFGLGGRATTPRWWALAGDRLRFSVKGITPFTLIPTPEVTVVTEITLFKGQEGVVVKTAEYTRLRFYRDQK